MNTATADQQARETFKDATFEQVVAVYVATYEPGRFTAREARNTRRWATQASVERVGYQVTADWQAAVTERVAG